MAKHPENELAPQTIRLLLVEDNPSDAVLVEEILREENHEAFLPIRYEVEHVTRLSKALTSIKEKKPDAVLLDLSLPDSQGLETLTTMHNADPSLPIIVLTGVDDENIAKRLVQKGAQDFLNKSQDLVGDLISHSIYFGIERNKGLLQAQEKHHQVHTNNLAFLSLIEQNPDPVVLLNNRQRVIFWNSAAEAFLGVPHEMLSGFHFDIPKTDLEKPLLFSRPALAGYIEVNLRSCGVGWQGEPAQMVQITTVRQLRYPENGPQHDGEFRATFALSITTHGLRRVPLT